MKTMNLLISVTLFIVALGLNVKATDPALKIVTYLLGSVSVFSITAKCFMRHSQ